MGCRRRTNVEETKSVEFEIAPPPDECDVYAQGGAWAPDHCAISFGGTVRWHLEAQPHDVWLIEPGADPASPGFEVTDGPTSGGDPISYQFHQTGIWTFVCKLHSFVNDGSWQGMVGTVSVAPPGPDTTPPETTLTLNGAPPEPSYSGPVTGTFTATDPGPGASGVDFTEYRVDSDSEDDWQTYNQLSPPVVGAPGPHEIDYRSHDLAGNVEETKSVAFEVSDAVGEPALGLSAQPEAAQAAAEGEARRFPRPRLEPRRRRHRPGPRLRECAEKARPRPGPRLPGDSRPRRRGPAHRGVPPQGETRGAGEDDPRPLHRPRRLARPQSRRPGEGQALSLDHQAERARPASFRVCARFDNLRLARELATGGGDRGEEEQRDA